MISKRLICSAAICLAVFILGLSFPARLVGGIEFSTPGVLRIAGKLLGIAAHDLSGDGLKDIVALGEVEGEGGDRPSCFVSIFFQEEAGRFASRPSHVIEIDSTVTLISPLSLPGEDRGILIYVARGGVYTLFNMTEGGDATGKRLADVETSVMTASREAPVFYGYVGDWNGDGSDDILVFDFEGFSFLTFEGGNNLGVRSHVSSPPILRTYQRSYSEGSSTMRGDTELVMRYGFPVLVSGEFNGDGREDLFISSGNRLAVSVQDAEGGFSGPVMIKKFVKPVPEGNEDNLNLRVGLTDIDGDGLMDISEAWWKGTGLSGTEAEIRLYLGRGASGFGADPDRVIEVEDAIPDILVYEDLDGDGKKELLVPTMKLGIMSFVRILTSGVLQIKALVYDDARGRVFEEEPRFLHSLSAKIEFTGRSYLASGLDDFDGDGNMDLAFSTDKDEISVYQGTGGRGNRMFTRDPVLVLHEGSAGRLETDDLDGNGKVDIILYYPSSDVIKVFFSGTGNGGRES